MDQLLTVREFAKALNITTSCVRRWLREKKVSTIKLGRLTRIPVSECERLIAEGLRPAKKQVNKSEGHDAGN